MTNKHKNYELLNLIGYGLAKFDKGFVKELGFNSKSAFYEHIVNKNIAETTGTVKNRQDLFDPFFDNKRKGWWQKGDAYIHRKTLIDSLYGELEVNQYANIVKLHVEKKVGEPIKPEDQIEQVSPVLRSKFNQLQVTGQKAELYFIKNYQSVEKFKEGVLDDARLLGDGYDFQVQVKTKYYLAEIKGVRGISGSIRLTKNEYFKAQEYQNDYSLVVISHLDEIPKVTSIFNPIKEIKLEENITRSEQVSYHSKTIKW